MIRFGKVKNDCRDNVDRRGNEANWKYSLQRPSQESLINNLCRIARNLGPQSRA